MEVQDPDGAEHPALIALVGLVGRSIPPAAVGGPYVRQ
jgi:hypothetical protein